MKRDFRGRFASKGRSINKFVTGFVWERMKVAGMIFVFAFSVSAWTVYKSSTSENIQAQTTTVIVEAKREVPKMLQRIAKCESKTGQYKDGQVVINATMDIGKYQINLPTWAKTATKMGLDLSKPEDNEKFAMWLFDEQGAQPWISSSKCWK